MNGGVKRDREMLTAVHVGSKHVGRHEACARIVAFIAENTVQLQRMPDALMDLEHHLVGCEEESHWAAWANGRVEELHGFGGDTRGFCREVPRCDGVLISLLTSASTCAHGAALGESGTMGDRSELGL